MTDIDRTIQDVEQLYRSLTGRPPGNGEASAHGAIPPETDPARYVEGQMDRLLSLLGTAPPAPQQQTFTPPISVWETDESYLAIVDLPGVPRDSVKVSVAGQGLVVQAVRPSPRREPSQARLRHQEHPVGNLMRVVPLPADASLDQVEARIVDGTLHLQVPRTGARGRNIEIH